LASAAPAIFGVTWKRHFLNHVPKVFDPDTPIPLAIGANNQLIELGIAKQAVGGILSWWCSRPEYRAALARGGNRHNIDGSIHGPISTDDQQHAADQISRARERARGGEL